MNNLCIIFLKEVKKVKLILQWKDLRIANWKGKMIISYILSDIVKTTIFLPFEARKQRLQLYHKTNDITISNVSRYMLRAYFPMILRDIIFRTITLGTFLNSLNVEHQPKLKYNLNEIRDFIKIKENEGERIQPSSFMDFSKFYVISPFPVVMANLVSCTIAATLITHPLDVIVTKIMTQTRLKYRGLFQSFKLIAKEEGHKKLFVSGLSFRVTFNILSSMTVFILYENMINFVKKYYEE